MKKAALKKEKKKTQNWWTQVKKETEANTIQSEPMLST